MKIAITGNTGLIGSRFIRLLSNSLDICPLSTSTIIDITNKELVFESLNKINPLIILHLAAKTDVDGCEKDKNDDLQKLQKANILKNNEVNFNEIDNLQWQGNSGSFAINVAGTKNLADFAEEKNIKFIYISTDFVFDGEQEYYSEEDNPHPINWYGTTKFWGEKYVNKYTENFLIVRPSYPYGVKSEVKKDFLWKMVDFLKLKKEGSFVYDQVITPTFIDDIVYGLDFLIKNKASGIYHLVGNSFISPYEIGLLLADSLNIKRSAIHKIAREKYYKDRARRPFQSRIKNDKIVKLGFKTKTFEQGLDILKNTI